MIALILWIQFGGFLAFLGGGFYLLLCLNRSAKALERLAELSAIQMARHDAFYLKTDEPNAPQNVAPAVQNVASSSL